MGRQTALQAEGSPERALGVCFNLLLGLMPPLKRVRRGYNDLKSAPGQLLAWLSPISYDKFLAIVYPPPQPLYPSSSEGLECCSKQTTLWAGLQPAPRPKHGQGQADCLVREPQVSTNLPQASSADFHPSAI